MIDPGLARSVRVTMRAAVLCVVLALAATGCGGEETPAPGGSGAGDPAAAPEGRLAGPLEFKVTGGEALRRDRMTVRPDGSASVETREGHRTATLSEQELATVARELEEAELSEIPEDSLTKPPIPDALAYSFVYGGREVSTDSGSMPERLEPLIGTFLKLVERYGAA